MATPASQSDVFKFVSLRPPQPPSRDAASNNFTFDERPARETPVGCFLAQFNADNAADLPSKLRVFIAEHRYDLGLPQSAGDKTLDVSLSAAKAVPGGKVSTESLRDAIESATGQTLDALYTSDAAKKRREGVWDCYYAFYLLSGFEGQDLTPLATNLRTFHLLNLLQCGQSVPDAATLATILGATVVVDKVFTALPKPKAALPAPSREPLSPAKITQFTALWDDLVHTNQALADVRGLGVTTTTETKTQAVPPIRSLPVAPLTGARDVAAPGVDPAPTTSTVNQTIVNVRVAVDPAAFDRMPAVTKSALHRLQISKDNLVKADAITRLNTHLQSLASKVDAIDDPRFLDYMPPEAAQIRGIRFATERLTRIAIPQDHQQIPVSLKDNVRGQIKPLGLGDLKVVKQKLVSYQLGEVAHIENVLRGEYKERKYRVLDRTEQTLHVTTETSEDTTKDTQTTERFELQKQAENTIQEQMSVQAGVTVTGSYGMVTIGAHGDFAYGTSSSQSNKSASNFAREVVDKSVSRIQKSVKQEQITKQLHEVEEIDTHGLDNKGQPDNLTGVYRWVDKHYQMQIHNYGKRLMFEFIIPEPAAFYGYAQTHKPAAAIDPVYLLPEGLTHKDITENNYQGFIRDYRVQGCLPPPPEHKVVGVSLSSDAKIDNGMALAKSSKDLVVPQGYTCESLAASVSFIYQNSPQFKLSIGAENFNCVWTSNADTKMFNWNYGATYAFDGIIPVSIDIYNVNSYFVNVIANCARTWEAYELWQIQTFEKILAAYQALKTAYDQQVAARQVQQGVVIHGQNPLINRQIERTELKKGSTKLLMDTWLYGSFHAMKQGANKPPDFDIHLAVSEGKIEQFFEQAFEWENLTYLFYPYFWARANQWVSKINTYDNDPLFTQFLQAGAARVLVPVRTGYNDAVMYFLESDGAIWNGGDPPRLNDPMFISLADELREQTDDLEGATPEGDPWQVVLPTTLVYLQKDASLPAFP